MQILATTGIRKVSHEEGDVFLAQMFYERGSAGPVGELEKVLALTRDIQRFYRKLWGVYMEECSRSLTVVFVRSAGLVGQNVNACSFQSGSPFPPVFPGQLTELVFLRSMFGE